MAQRSVLRLPRWWKWSRIVRQRSALPLRQACSVADGYLSAQSWAFCSRSAPTRCGPACMHHGGAYLVHRNGCIRLLCCVLQAVKAANAHATRVSAEALRLKMELKEAKAPRRPRQSSKKKQVTVKASKASK